MTKIRTALVPIAFVALLASAQDTNEWESAVRDVARLDPDNFTSLPSPIREHLQNIGCKIPQTPHRPEPHNLVSGDLNGRAARDWAVLCSVEFRSALFVFWNGSTSNVSLVSEWSDDVNWLQRGFESIEFGRIISIADSDRIISACESYDQDLPITPTYDGLEEGFDGKASVIHYWDGSEWLQLKGAD